MIRRKLKHLRFGRCFSPARDISCLHMFLQNTILIRALQIHSYQYQYHIKHHVKYSPEFRALLQNNPQNVYALSGEDSKRKPVYCLSNKLPRCSLMGSRISPIVALKTGALFRYLNDHLFHSLGKIPDSQNFYISGNSSFAKTAEASSTSSAAHCRE